MVREVTIYNWKGTPAREKHYRNVIKQLEDSDFSKTYYRINNGNNTIKFWS